MQPCGLIHAKRSMGNILAHDGDAVHGVTALVKGVRLVARFSTFFFVPITSNYISPKLFPPFPYLYSYTSSHVWAVCASSAKSPRLLG